MGIDRPPATPEPGVIVVGVASYRPAEGKAGDRAGGLAAGIAREIATTGVPAQLVAKIGDDAAGDGLVLALARDSVGHAAVLRDPAHATPIDAGLAGSAGPGEAADDADLDVLAAEDEADELVLPADPHLRPSLEAADIDLALRYLGSARVVVLADLLDPEGTAAVAAGAGYLGAALVALVPAALAIPPALADATILARPSADPDGAFARLVASYAAALARDGDPEAAFAAAVARGGWERSTPE